MHTSQACYVMLSLIVIISQGQTLVNVVRACNCPRLLKTIKNELEREHKVLDGALERKPVSLKALC